MESFKRCKSSAVPRKFLAFFLLIAVVACLLVGESMAGKGKGEGDDIILYNGNIVLRGGGKGKGKGKGGGSIVVANSAHHGEHHHEYMPMYGGGWGGFRR